MGTTPDSLSRRIERAAVDDLLEFGAYPQTGAHGGGEPIRWRVLDVSGHDVLVVSDRILDCRRYHRGPTGTTWRDCDLRAWLGDEFFPAAFDADERRIVVPTTCSDNGDGSPDTVDRVFLLSVREVRSLTTATATGLPRRSAIGTPFAREPKADGCRLYVYDKGVEKDYVMEDGERFGCSWWWTRTQLQIQDGRSSRAAFIGARGDVKSYGRVDTTAAWTSRATGCAPR
jgi:hypothetical protein